MKRTPVVFIAPSAGPDGHRQALDVFTRMVEHGLAPLLVDADQLTRPLHPARIYAYADTLASVADHIYVMQGVPDDSDIFDIARECAIPIAHPPLASFIATLTDAPMARQRYAAGLDDETRQR